MADDVDRTRPAAEFTAQEDGDVPRLPRGRGMRLSGPQLVRIAGTMFLLVFLLVVQRPCANAVGTFVTGFGSAGDRGSAAAKMPRPDTMDVPVGSAGSASSIDMAGSGRAAGRDAPDLDQYEHLRPGMTDEEIEAVIDRARRKAAAGSAVPLR